jgi:sugar phosphate isomerase/epimerase
MKKRRDFLKDIGMLAAGSFFLPSFAIAQKKVKNPGIQLYTFRDEMLRDARGTLKQIAALGIKQIESASSSKGYYYGLSPKEMKQVCNDLGMTLRSGHVALNNKWQETMNEAAESGQEYLICSSLPGKGQTVDNYKRVADAFNKAGEECRKLNLKFGYHNHNYEFQEEKGEVLYDILLKNSDPDLVHMELDLGWVVASGKDPFEYFKNFSGRFPLWHLKDMSGQHSTEFGKGRLDIVRLLKSSEQSGLKYFFIEQEDYTSTPLESMKYNMEYLKGVSI